MARVQTTLGQRTAMEAGAAASTERLHTRPIHLNNKGGEAYNIISMAYDHSPAGAVLKQEVRCA
jgi:hypothetical protein